MEFNSCTRGPEDLRPELHVDLSPGAPGLLVLKPAACARVELLLPQRYVFLLIVLAWVWFEDDAAPEALRGFRSAAEIGDRFAKVSPRGSIRAAAVKALVHEASARIRKAIESHASGYGFVGGFDLFERRRSLGYRIAECGLDVKLRRRRECVA